MPLAVRIPEALRRLTGGRGEVTAEGGSIAELLDDLEARFKGVRAWACDEAGALRPYANVFINREEVRGKGGLAAPVSSGDIVSIVPAVAGGAVSTRKLYLTFPQELIREPIIFRVGHDFKVVTNIRGASVSDNIGFVAIEIEGEAAELDRAVAWLKKKGVKIEPLPDEV
jgi:molybdopterin converting factor small subunit